MATLRIMSTNLLLDRADPADLRRVIAAADPDVIAAQELGPRTSSVIAERHPHGHLDPRKDCFGLGVASRHPVETSQLILQGRSGWIARLEPETWPGLSRPVEIIGVHLLNPIDRPWKKNRDDRRRQIAQIAEHVGSTDAATVVIGDMNSSPRWEEYRRLGELGRDAALATDTATPTWQRFTRGPRVLRIDHAFVAGIRPVTTRAVSIRGTDHKALIVDLDISAE